jgi:hypothetical protein
MTSTDTKNYAVIQYDGDDANGVASIVGTLIRQNLDGYPARTSVARHISRPVAIYSTDTDTAATIIFGHATATVYNDIVDHPGVTIMATVDQILDVSQLKMNAGGLVPVGFLTRRGLHVIADIVRHRLVVRGLLTHTIATLRFISLVSVAS